MSIDHDSSKPPRRVAEPVQVYLDAVERARLERLAAQLDATKSAVLRRALEALEREVTDPATHPALQLIGLVGGERPEAAQRDVARDHDQFLAESEVASWQIRSVRGDG
jgi:hypothetical protein